MQQIIDLLEELSDYFQDRADVKDGSNEDGSQIPNKEMTFLTQIEQQLNKLRSHDPRTYPH